MQTEEMQMLQTQTTTKFEALINVIAEKQDLIPTYATAGAAGADLKANVKEPIVIAAHQMKMIPTGIRLEIPAGFEVQIRPRSGLAAKSMVTVLNSPGTIDSDYRGEINVLLINHSEQDFVVTYGMRIAQMVVAPVCIAQFCEVSQLSESTRGQGGFGHTGTH
jgi:dUTP pyrophosphatase